MGTYIRGTANIAEPLLNDYIKVDLLMRDTAAVLTALGQLNTDMGGPAMAALQDSDRSNYVKLSDALAFYESKCWFPQVHIILVGILSTADFLKFLGDGYMVKDVGAGANHGEFSHRLQWHAIMRAATSNFTVAKAAGWSNSPYDLYCSYGEGVGLQGGVWGRSLDNQGINVDFRNPRVLDTQIRGGNLNLLATKLTNVFAKRIVMTNKTTDWSAVQADRETRTPGTQQRTQQAAYVKLGGDYQSQLAGPAYTAHKGVSIQGQNVVSHAATMQANDPTINLNAFVAAEALPSTPAVKILKELDLYEKPSWWDKPKFKICMSNGALIRTSETLLTERQIRDRRQKSRVALHV